MGLLSWVKGSKEGKTAMVPIEAGTGVSRSAALVSTDSDDEIVVYEDRKASGITLSPARGAVVQVREKSVKIDGKVYKIDPQHLIRMIKQVTQTIGEYKNKDNPYSAYVVGALRKARSDMVSDLEHHFKIQWEIDEGSGRSVFYMG